MRLKDIPPTPANPSPAPRSRRVSSLPGEDDWSLAVKLPGPGRICGRDCLAAGAEPALVWGWLGVVGLARPRLAKASKVPSGSTITLITERETGRSPEQVRIPPLFPTQNRRKLLFYFLPLLFMIKSEMRSCVYLEAASQLFLIQTELKRFPEKGENKQWSSNKCKYNHTDGRERLSTLLDVFWSGISLSDRSLLSISSQFRSLSLNSILEKQNICPSEHTRTHTNLKQIKLFSPFSKKE